MSGFLAPKFPCLQFIPCIEGCQSLRFISPSSSHCTYLPIENTLRGSHCLLNYIQFHSSISCPPLSAPYRLWISLAPLSSLTAGAKSWMFFQFHIPINPYSYFVMVSQVCPWPPHPLCFLGASFLQKCPFSSTGGGVECSWTGPSGDGSCATRGHLWIFMQWGDISSIPPHLAFPWRVSPCSLRSSSSDLLSSKEWVWGDRDWASDAQGLRIWKSSLFLMAAIHHLPRHHLETEKCRILAHNRPTKAEFTGWSQTATV